ncbi:PREDICTED: MATH domain and coiled-coil domain-containing protein At1g31390-like [Erythranthe guttata]|uniref:MATH domain and coiled-coil domain-containing protein At1g31390-like n=1 Tax=Erythranthe guttata TaxID=4155 RepID=UPI00064DDDF4|nr:PREDICTED: MATH domain and coiled-coil domain-containing protein At1g31390-like [Erythranthe guttata]|eukprot:XP_012851653.1 PREDICTED: MATH domain and coiled-coil domain-containing protein At1g31390-like [Erythranthe guttata]
MGNCLYVKPATKDVTTLNTREAPPAHYMIKIESFSVLEKYGTKKYETKEFVAGDYKWKILLYPKGNAEGTGSHVSIYFLAMADTSSLPANWEVNVFFNIFLYNQISGNYLSSPDPSNGYLVNDNIVFGAEVFVVKKDAVIECVSLNNINIHYKHDFKISDFSKLNE